MVGQIERSLKEYAADWEAWQQEIQVDAAATAVGWKVADYGEFTRTLEALLPESPQVHIADVNDRKIGSFVRTEPLPMGIYVVKLMQRREGSSDATGLDHVDFTVKDLKATEDTLQKHNVTYEWQRNDAHEWISARITNGREAKFVDHTVLDVGAQELTDESNKIRQQA